MSGYPYQFDHQAPVGTTPEFTCEWKLENGSDFPWSEYDILYRVLRDHRSVGSLSVGTGILVNATDNLVTFTPPDLHCGDYRHVCDIQEIASGRVLPVFDGDLLITGERS